MVRATGACGMRRSMRMPMNSILLSISDFFLFAAQKYRDERTTRVVRAHKRQIMTCKASRANVHYHLNEAVPVFSANVCGTAPDPTTCVLPRCAHALANQGGCRHKWNEILLDLCLDASAPGPRPRSGCVESIGDCLYSFQSQHECAVAPGCWTHPCASCPRKSWLIGDCLKQACSIGDCRTLRGPPIGWTEIFGPAGIRPGTL